MRKKTGVEKGGWCMRKCMLRVEKKGEGGWGSGQVSGKGEMDVWRSW